jgi:T5SS/PEP-CTERM-associated repeat protein
MRTLALLALVAGGLCLQAEDNTALVVDGQTLSSGGALVIGDTGTNNSLAILHGGKLTNTTATVGAQITARGNRAIVRDPGSVWHVQDALTIGQQGAFNALVITNEGRVFSNFGYVGSAWPQGSNASAVVWGPQSSWTVGKELHVGLSSSRCTLTIAKGGSVEAGTCSIGRSYSEGNSLLVVEGPGSRLIVHADLTISDYGRTNSLRILDGASVRCTRFDCGRYTNARKNHTLVDGPGSTLDVLGRMEIKGEGDRLEISRGAELTSLTTLLYGTQVLLEGSGSWWQCSSLNMEVGATNLLRNGATLIVTNGAGTADLRIGGASLQVRDAFLSADVLVLTNYVSGVYGMSDFRFHSGVVEAGRVIMGDRANTSSEWGPEVFRVGDGTNVARLRLLATGGHPSKASLVVAQDSFLEARGLLLGRITNYGTIAFSATNSLEVDGRLWNRGALQFELAAGRDAALPYFITRSNASLGGTLSLNLAANSARLTNGLTLMKWKTRTGEFENAPDGARVPVGVGSVRVDYTPEALLVADYQEDLDGDDIDDAWARAYFAHTPLTAAEKAEDPDRDGMPTGAEAVAGTDPLDPASVFKIKAVSLDTQHRTVLRFTYTSGKRYRVWGSQSVDRWAEVANPSFTYPSAGEAEWTEPSVTFAAAQFYRVSVE